MTRLRRSDAAPAPRVGSPIIFRAQKEGREHVVRPCSGAHRELWLSGYIVLSCGKCKIAPHEIEAAS